MSLARAPRISALTVARVDAIEIAVHWRWAPVVVLGTLLLAHSVLPARYPAWDVATFWLTSAAAVVCGEGALLLHELAHAMAARRTGHAVRRIVFHGFLAHTEMADVAPEHEFRVALAGPLVNVTLAGAAELARLAVAPPPPTDVVLFLIAAGNLAAAVMSLLPAGDSDGGRALRAVLRARNSDCQ